MHGFEQFQQTVWGFYQANGRHDLPWRLPDAAGWFDPYKIMVSEIMLQQTQVARVIPKFEQFIIEFPDVRALAAAPLGRVLSLWSGLGYNRRAKFLWQASRLIAQDYDGTLPDNHEKLVALPGIGANTAGAILAYAFDRPVVFIETNIRTVFIHHFLADQQGVSDAIISKLVRDSLPATQTREWYWALMDYGTNLKQTVGNLSRQSNVFSSQSQFEGSRRQVRGQVLRLLAKSSQSTQQISAAISDSRLGVVIDELIAEGLVIKADHGYRLP